MAVADDSLLDEMLPFEEVAEYLGVDTGIVRMFQRLGVLEFAYGCSQWMIERELLDRLVERYGDARRAAEALDPRRHVTPGGSAPGRRVTDH